MVHQKRCIQDLQQFDEIVFLPPKGKGKRNKFVKLVNIFGSDYLSDIGKGPLDIVNEFNDKNDIQTLKTFDLFISHCVNNTKLVDDVVRYLNGVGMVAFVDWKSDKEDMKRSKSSQYTADVLQLRMRQSDCLLLVRTAESDKSIWVSWELGYYAALNKRICVLEVEEELSEVPEFMRGYPRAFWDNEKIFVSESHVCWELSDWIKHSSNVRS